MILRALRAALAPSVWLITLLFWLTGYFIGWHYNELERGETLDALRSRAVECQSRCGPAGCPAPDQARPQALPIKIHPEPGVPTPYQTSVRVHYRIGDSLSTGSGTIVDGCAKRALVLTCAHLFRGRGGVYPRPTDARGSVRVDVFHSGPQGFKPPTSARTLPGRVVDFDSVRDVGLVAFEPETDLPAAPLVPDDFRAERGDRFVSVGCSHGADPSAREHRLTGETSHGGYAAYWMTNAPVEGRSGGGLFTPAGRLAGVCLSTDGERGQYAQPVSMRFILARNGRDDLAHPKPTAAKEEADPELSIIPGQAGHHARPSPQIPPAPPASPAVPAFEPPTAPALPVGLGDVLKLMLAGAAGFAFRAVYVWIKSLERRLGSDPPPPKHGEPKPPASPTDPQDQLRAALRAIVEHADRQKAELSHDQRVNDLLSHIHPTSSPASKAATSG